MSRKFGIVDSGFWRSRKMRGASDQAKLLCLYLISCPHGNSVGLFHIPLAYIQADLGWSEKQVRIQVSELVSRHILEFDFDHDLLRFVGWWQHNPIDNGKHAAAVARQMAELKCDSEVFRNHIKGLQDYAAESGKGYLNCLRARSDTGIDTGIQTGTDIQTLTQTQIQIPSEANASAPPGLDLKALVFDRGVKLQTAKGIAEDAARSFLGKAIASTSVGDVLEAIGRAEREDPVDPRAFIRGVLKPKIRTGKPVAAPAEVRKDRATTNGLDADRRRAAEDQARAEGLHPMTTEGMARVAQILREAA